jgi:hypothetical protein
VFLFLAAAGALIFKFRERVHPAHMALVLPILFFAGMFALISAPFLQMFNGMLLFGLLLVVIRYGTKEKPFFTDSLVNLIGGLMLTGIGLIGNPFFVLNDSKDWVVKIRLRLKHEQTAQVRSVLRGCFLALPILLVFTALLASADMVFSDFLESLVSWISPPGFGWVEQLFIIGAVAWATSAWLDMLMVDRYTSSKSAPTHTWGSPDAAPYGNEPFTANWQPPVVTPKPPKPFRLGMIESVIVLVSVNLLFFVFVIIQARYFFGGKSNINAEGYTYSAYARRGFFELVIVSLFTMLLIVILDAITRRQGNQTRLFQGLAVGMIVLTLVILVSAFRRMGLYEDAYGFTRLRVFTHVFMIWLAALFVALILDLFRLYPRLFWIGSGVAALGFFATLNLMNVDGFIADRNIDRYYDTGKLDVAYLTSLSDDAVPAMVTLLYETELSEDDHTILVCNLWDRLTQLDDRHESSGVFGYHRNHERAWDLLKDRRDALKDVDSRICPVSYRLAE